ncbi:hypothetical protein VZT92_003662 [Zoarces viviparus]|uniref:Uncharacterized protein n=1 Tax=Zoarces viviparus TaxID=48416 RepID=A0AAW1FV54_ZOAVI
MSIFVILGLLVCIEAQGSSAVTTVFVQKGDDLILNVDADVPERFMSVVWKFNKMNLEEADSGVYTAEVLTHQGYKQLVEYKVTVQGSSNVTTVFLQKGDDLILNVDDVTEEVFLVDWKFNKMAYIVIFAPDGNRSVHNEFIGRVEFLVKKFSVKLKNLQEADSGVYAAGVLMHQGEKQLVEYKVTVQGPEGSSAGPSAGTSVYLVKMVVFSVGLIIMVSAVITVHLMEKFRKHK